MVKIPSQILSKYRQIPSEGLYLIINNIKGSISAFSSLSDAALIYGTVFSVQLYSPQSLTAAAADR